MDSRVDATSIADSTIMLTTENLYIPGVISIVGIVDLVPIVDSISTLATEIFTRYDSILADSIVDSIPIADGTVALRARNSRGPDRV